MEKGVFTIEKSTVECYKIRHSSGMCWADITIDSNGNTGRIQIASDYGSWQYYWGACGCPFKKFLGKIDMEYTADKFGESKWFDIDKTMRAYREYILESRRIEQFNADKAREMWEEVKLLTDSSNSTEFGEIMRSQCEVLFAEFDYCPDVHYSVSPLFVKFWKNVWPVLLEQFKKEVVSITESQTIN